MKKIIVMGGLLFFTTVVNATDLSVHGEPADCSAILAHPQHFADDDVAFKPGGTDAYGRPVDGPNYNPGGTVTIEPPSVVGVDVYPKGAPAPGEDYEVGAGSIGVDLETGQIVTDEMRAAGITPKEAYQQRYEECLKASQSQ